MPKKISLNKTTSFYGCLERKMLPILSCVDNIVHKMIDLKVTIGQGHDNVYEFILFQSFLLFSNSDVHQSKDFKIIVWKKKSDFFPQKI